MNICRYCKRKVKNSKKLPQAILNFVKWKVPSVTKDDLFCEECYAKLKARYEQMKQYKKNQQITSVITSTTDGTTDTSTSIGSSIEEILRELPGNSQKRKADEVKKTNVLPIRELISTEESFSLSTKDLENSPVRIPINTNVTSRKPTSKRKEEAPHKTKVVRIITGEGIVSRSEIEPAAVPVLPILEEIEYEDSDDDIFDPAIPLPTVQPLIKRKKLVRSKDEPLNWTYKNGG